MTYEQAVEYINNIPKFTKKNKPGHTRQFLEYLGDPQKKLKVIHVAGTNGKGSVCAYMDAILQAEGKTVGLFTSPHLVKMNERIMINGNAISDRMFSEIFEKTMKAVESMQVDGLPHPTFFEFLFGMAVTAFAEADVEYAVLETGLGGRLDATNTVEHPVCSVITSIGLDHMEILGDTIEEIAAEKAGIIKKDTPVYYIECTKESDAVIEKKAEEAGAVCHKVAKNAFEILGIENKRIAFSLINAYYEGVTWTLSNTGLYQAANAALALEVMRGIFGEQAELKLWRQALADVVWPGRMEEVLPGVFIDGAHNIAAIEQFVRSIPDQGRGSVILFSAVQDKDYTDMIAYLCRHVQADYFMVTQIADRRAADTERLAEVFRQYTEQPVLVKEEIKDAWEYVTARQDGRLIYCVGSLYLVGMIKELLENRGDKE